MDIKTGDRFALLTVIKEVPKPENRKTKGKYYLCQCDCGNQKIIDKKGLVSGRVQSCGCLRAKRVSEAITIDLTGQRFGRLTVLEKVDYKDTPQKCEAKWRCQCDCGNIVEVRGTSLRKGATQSCGCLHNELFGDNSRTNEVGNTYGLLTVIEYAGSSPRQDALWLCKCQCGNTKIVAGKDLRSGHTSSCGCLISKGEALIAKVLQNHNIQYKSQYTDNTLKTKNNGQYKFDFAILNNNSNPIGMIEFNGKQHYEQSDFFDSLEDIRYRDRQKSIWCQTNGIPLLVIPYWKIDEIDTSVNNFLTYIKTQQERASA